ncbi:MAG: LuxR C-terminal-related transcriptional regulator [Dehalococcoidia bacterium]
MAKRGRPRHPDILTPREWQVLALLRERRSNEEIAERLAISLAGAKYHVSEILSKLGVASRDEAALWQPTERPWWAAVVAPLGALWRAASASRLSVLGAAVAATVVGAGLGLLVWGVVRTGGNDEPPELGGALSAPGDLAATATVSPLPEGVIDLGDGSFGGADWSPNGLSLAYSQGGSLYRADSPDFAPRLLARQTSTPRWSPDGTRIAFIGAHPGRGGIADDYSSSIWVVNADGSGLRDLLPGAAAELSPSTEKSLHGWLDDQTLAFDEGCGTACRQPFTMDVRTGAVSQAVRFAGVTTGAEGVGILGTVYTWSPDQRYVAVEDMTFPTVLLYDRSTQELTRLAPQGRRTPWQRFDAWAPDSSAFLYEENPSDGTSLQPPVSLRLWNVASGQSRLVASIGKDGAWSPDGSLIAYVTGAAAERPCGEHGAETACIAVMDVASGAEQYRVPGPGAAHLEGADTNLPPLIFLSDDRLLYTTAAGAVRLTNGEERTLLLSPEQITDLVLSPGERFIIVAEPSRLLLVPIPPP